eukprot:GHVU01049568.1.p1 GENE.GHVU01049568.1~~GHVU01049568.1.p1  ORF type:complete len:106 (-),score=8.19 GHVU01049568.1:122-439(-)
MKAHDVHIHDALHCIACVASCRMDASTVGSIRVRTPLPVDALASVWCISYHIFCCAMSFDRSQEPEGRKHIYVMLLAVINRMFVQLGESRGNEKRGNNGGDDGAP